MDEEVTLAGYGVETDHVPEKPGLHCAGVGVTGETGGCGGVETLCYGAGAEDGVVGEVYVVV